MNNQISPLMNTPHSKIRTCYFWMINRLWLVDKFWQIQDLRGIKDLIQDPGLTFSRNKKALNIYTVRAD